ncbi:MAG: hypothetical protein AB4040_21255 [Synechococcus sp.]
MKIYLHIGTHKTGTTSIQRFARANEDEFKKQGWIYPDYSIINKKGHYAHHHFAHALALEKNNRFGPETALKFIKKAIIQAEKYNVLFLSAEPLYRHYHGDHTCLRRQDTYWSARKSFVQCVRDCFVNHDVEIIISIRRQADFALSVYQENIKVRKYGREFTSFLYDQWFLFKYLQQIRLWEDIFGKIHILVFEDLLKDSDLVKSFFSSLGLNTESFPKPQVVNERLCPDFIEYKRRMNLTSSDPEFLTRLRNFLQETNSQWIKEHDINPKELIVSKNILNSFQTQFIQENEQIVSRYFQNQRNSLFPKNSFLSARIYQGLTNQRSDEITARFMQHIQKHS